MSSSTLISDYLSQGAGPPSTAPPVKSGVTALYWDTTNLLAYVYDWNAAAWKRVGLIQSVPAGATVATDETTSATSYGDLATAGPAVTLITGTTALLWLSADVYKPSTGNTAWMSIAVSGATTLAASDANGAASAFSISNAFLPCARALILTGLTAGSNTFTAKYRCDGGSTHHFVQRSLIVLAP